MNVCIAGVSSSSTTSLAYYLLQSIPKPIYSNHKGVAIIGRLEFPLQRLLLLNLGQTCFLRDDDDGRGLLTTSGDDELVQSLSTAPLASYWGVEYPQKLPSTAK